MAAPSRNLGEPASSISILNTSTQSNTSTDSFYRHTQGIDFHNFTTNTALPLHDMLADGKRMHDAIRENALSVLDIDKKKRQLEFEQSIKKKIKAEARLAHQLKMQKIKQEKYAKKLQDERIGGANDLAAAEAAIAEIQQARASSPPQQPYKLKNIGQTQVDEIIAAIAVMDESLKRQVYALIFRQCPDSIWDEDFGREFDPNVLNIDTLSRIHDLVQRHFPDLATSTPTAIELPAAEPAAPAAQPVAPVAQSTAPTARSASPQRTSPRNYRGLGVDPAASRSAANVVPAMTATENRDHKLALQVDCLGKIHKHLKEFRKDMERWKKENLHFKAACGSIRRGMQGRLNVISKDKQGNNQARTAILKILRDSLRPNCGIDEPAFAIPQCKVNKFTMLERKRLVPEPAVGLNDDTLPVTFIYAIHMLAKMTVKKFIEECSSDTSKADNVGLLVSSIFAMPEFQYRGQSLYTILSAKICHDCPVLYGVRGSEKTEEGRTRLGWRRYKEGGWVDVQTHNQRMTGLAAGFSSIALRDYSRSTTMNTPCPPDSWWNTVAAIVDTPIEEASDTQLTVLKYVIDGWEDKIFCLWGDKGLLQLSTSIRLFSGRMTSKSGAVLAIGALWETLVKKWGIPTVGRRIGSPLPYSGMGHCSDIKSPVWGPTSPMHGLVVGDGAFALQTPTF